jgi:hypothetical protein
MTIENLRCSLEYNALVVLQGLQPTLDIAGIHPDASRDASANAEYAQSAETI